MKRAQTVYFYLIEKEQLQRAAIATVLDMLRYDGSTVETNAPPGYYLFRTPGVRPDIARWKTFGIDVACAGSLHELQQWYETTVGNRSKPS